MTSKALELWHKWFLFDGDPYSHGEGETVCFFCGALEDELHDYDVCVYLEAAELVGYETIEVDMNNTFKQLLLDAKEHSQPIVINNKSRLLVAIGKVTVTVVDAVLREEDDVRRTTDES